MTDREIQRRKLTGTLFSGTVTAGMLSVMGHGGERFVHAGDPDARKNLELDVTRFQVECSSKFYNAPSYVTIPASSSRTSGKNLTDLQKARKMYKNKSLFILLSFSSVKDQSRSFLVEKCCTLRTFAVEIGFETPSWKFWRAFALVISVAYAVLFRHVVASLVQFPVAVLG